jgi:hypothetical protein
MQFAGASGMHRFFASLRMTSFMGMTSRLRRLRTTYFFNPSVKFVTSVTV